VFAFLNFMDAHDRIRPPFEYRARFDPTAVPYRWTDWFRPLGRATHSEDVLRTRLEARYDAAIAFMDDELGRLFQTLGQRRPGRDLVVVVTADHGESLGERGLYGHRSALYVGQIRVPLVVYAPGRAPGGIRVERIVGLDGVPRMLAALATSERVAPADGLALMERAMRSDGTAVSELDRIPFRANPSWPSHTGRIDSIVSDDWHYVEHEKRGGELFDWRRDPAESNDLLSTPDGARVAADLRARLRERLGRGGLPAHARNAAGEEDARK
jgi:arylsulfatase A-like enzyme